MFSKPEDRHFKYARIEEERRFLLQAIPRDLNLGDSFVRIFDQYIPGTRLRLRRIQSPAGQVMVYKFGQKYRAADLESHQAIMTNIYLDDSEYSTLGALGGRSLTKRRYAYPYQGRDYSIDVFEGHLQGLILAEIEGREHGDIASLPVPGFALREVTGDPMFTGGQLAGLSAGEFQTWLAAQF
jgi:CYTH domain-containing protein